MTSTLSFKAALCSFALCFVFLTPAHAASIGAKQVTITDSKGVKRSVSLAEAMRLQGIPARPADLAIQFFDRNASNLDNHNYLTIIDMQKHSGSDRFFLTNLNTGKVEKFVVAHGKGSDPDHDGLATRFSNIANSNATSLGFYQVSETYSGKHGYSVRLDGLSPTNSKARARAVVIHGASYVKRGLAKMGRSFGCPALDDKLSTGVIQRIKEGSLLLIYSAPHESKFVEN